MAGIAPQSLAAGRRLPSVEVASSAGLGWRTVLARLYDDPPVADGVTTGPTPDLLVVMHTSGWLRIESRRPRGWVAASYRPGAVGVSAPGTSPILRWRASSAEPLGSLHLHLSAGLLRNTAGGLGRPRLVDGLPGPLLLSDPYVVAAAGSMLAALRGAAPALYADSLAQGLAAHLLYGRLLPEAMPRSTAGVRRVVQQMRDQLAEPLTLDDLAATAGLSSYHFLRVFTAATGLTPHRYLVRLRLRRAAELLRTTELPTAEVAARCGYASRGQFAAAFRGEYGANPAAYRNGSR